MTTNVMATHGRFSWSELCTSDVAAAKTFYGDVLGWKFREIPMDEHFTYHIIQVEGQDVGGMMTPPGNAQCEAPVQSMPPMWGTYVTVDDVDARAAKAAAAGGKVLMSPQDIPNVGRFAMLQDPQGAIINLISYKTPAQDCPN